MIVTAATIFLSAFLLFLVQPLTARGLLPSFGGSAAVWLVCLVFFQISLLGGYCYAHVLGRLSTAKQAFLHAGLVALALFSIWALGPRPAPSVSGDPTGNILTSLTVRLAIPVVLLAATSPLLQRWASEAPIGGGDVYRLFAISNLGSLLGLWCYPFGLEPLTTLATQWSVWSVGYSSFAACAFLVCLSTLRNRAVPAVAVSDGGGAFRVDLPTRTLWLALPAVAALHLFATSNQLTRNVASVPFLWILPLSLYIVSFIATFESSRWYVRWFWVVAFLTSLGFVLSFLMATDEPDFVHQLLVYSVNLLSGCMICHGELARERPVAAGLTGFYLHVAAGGALGGLFVSVLAPQIFVEFWEHPLSLVAVYLVGGASILLSLIVEESRRTQLFVVWGLGALVLVGILANYVSLATGGSLLVTRNFFGVLRVYERFPDTERWQRYLLNGAITHGSQLLTEERRGEPTLYYGPDTGVGIALQYDLSGVGRAKHVAIIGLGAGGLAAHGQPGDRYRFYELNPEVVEVARELFTYLEDSEAEITVVEGDGRLSLERELRETGGRGRGFDVIAVDAFTGDAVPVHLLTKEAFELFAQHLAPDGVIAVHVSNLHFDLKPVVRAQAEHLSSVAVLIESDADEERNLYVSDWVLVTKNARFLGDSEVQARWTPFRVDDRRPVEEFLWTDDFSNLFRLLR